MDQMNLQSFSTADMDSKPGNLIIRELVFNSNSTVVNIDDRALRQRRRWWLLAQIETS